MKMAPKIALFTGILTALTFVGAGCISFGAPSAGPGSDGGVFKSTDSGEVWQLRSDIATTDGQKRSFSNANVHLIVQDPQDPNAVYAATAENGLYFTYDSGASWRQPKDLARGRVWSVAIHPKDKCTIYATAGNKLVKSEDCARSWSVPFLDSRGDVATKAVLIDSYNPNIIWLGLSTGDLLRSQDNGGSWTNIRSFEGEIMRLAASAADSRRLYVATKANGLWRSDDGGANWKELGADIDRDNPGYLREFKGSNELFELALGVSNPDLLVMASKYGLLRSRDAGDNWEAISLLTPPGEALIYSLAIDPKDANVLYFGTATTFVKSTNGGQDWITKRLPTSRAATVLKVDAANSAVLWMGATKFKN
jgi:photosystem II stability/assembly factor-like uncharacterized protein